MAKLGGSKLGAGRKLASSSFPKGGKLDNPKKLGGKKKGLVPVGDLKKGDFFLDNGQLGRVVGRFEDRVIINKGGSFIDASVKVRPISMGEAVTTKAMEHQREAR